MEEKNQEQPAVDNNAADLKIKPKMKDLGKQSQDYKIDLSKPIEPKEQENETAEKVEENNPDNEGVARVDENADATEKQEEVQPKAEAQESISAGNAWDHDLGYDQILVYCTFGKTTRHRRFQKLCGRRLVLFSL